MVSNPCQVCLKNENWILMFIGNDILSENFPIKKKRYLK